MADDDSTIHLQPLPTPGITVEQLEQHEQQMKAYMDQALDRHWQKISEQFMTREQVNEEIGKAKKELRKETGDQIMGFSDSLIRIGGKVDSLTEMVRANTDARHQTNAALDNMTSKLDTLSQAFTENKTSNHESIRDIKNDVDRIENSITPMVEKVNKLEVHVTSIDERMPPFIQGVNKRLEEMEETNEGQYRKFEETAGQVADMHSRMIQSQAKWDARMQIVNAMIGPIVSTAKWWGGALAVAAMTALARAAGIDHHFVTQFAELLKGG